jgi:hypothetical protein
LLKNSSVRWCARRRANGHSIRAAGAASGTCHHSIARRASLETNSDRSGAQDFDPVVIATAHRTVHIIGGRSSRDAGNLVVVRCREREELGLARMVRVGVDGVDAVEKDRMEMDVQVHRSTPALNLRH